MRVLPVMLAMVCWGGVGVAQQQKDLPPNFATVLPRQTVWVVDSAGMGDFLDIPPAVHAAAHDEVVLVVDRGGLYSGFTIQGKGVSVRAATTPFEVADRVTIKQIPQGRRAGIGGMLMQAFDDKLRIEDCDGLVMVDGFGTNNESSSRLEIVNSSRVAIAGMQVVDLNDPFGAGDPPLPLVDIQNSQVTIAQSSIYGTRGSAGPGCEDNGATGGVGVQASSGSYLILSETSVTGGMGGLGICCDGFSGCTSAQSGVGASAVVVDNSELLALGSSSSILDGGDSEEFQVPPFCNCGSLGLGEPLVIQNGGFATLTEVTLSQGGATVADPLGTIREISYPYLNVSADLVRGGPATAELKGAEPDSLSWVVFTDSGNHATDAVLGSRLQAVPSVSCEFVNCGVLLAMGRTNLNGELALNYTVSQDPYWIGRGFLTQYFVAGNSGKLYRSNVVARIVKP